MMKTSIAERIEARDIAPIAIPDRELKKLDDDILDILSFLCKIFG